MRRHVSMTVASLLLGACSGGTSATDTAATADTGSCPSVVSLTDPGLLCLNEDGLFGQLAAAGGCASILDGGCTATLDGDRVVVAGWAEVEPGCDPDEVCLLDVEGLFADCGLPTLTAGTWTLAYGDDEVVFDWPLKGDACLGERPETY